MKRAVLTALAAALAVPPLGCGLDVVDRWDGAPVVAREVASPPDSVFPRLMQGISALDLVVTRILTAERAVELAWVAPPGDGRRFLSCSGSDRVGTANIQPRVTVRATATGSRVIVASRVRGTTTSHCVSTGAFEATLLRDLEPRIAARDSQTAPATAQPD